MSTHTLTVHIHTQYRENYGTADQPYWKFKGGDTYVLTGFAAALNDRIGAAGAAAVDAVRASIEYANDVAEVYIRDWDFAAVDALTSDEQLQLEYDGRIIDPSPRVALPA